MLTGIERCGTYGAGMTLRTAKSGRYRYHTCADCPQKGKTAAPDSPSARKVVLEAYIARAAKTGASSREQD